MKNRALILIVGLFFINISIFAQFGKNKVQYEKFNWKYIQSENFDIYYNEGSKYLAIFAAFSAEQGLREYQKNLNFNITKRIPIIIYNTHNEFQQTNVISSFMPEGVGGVTELFKNRIVIPFQGNYAVFDHVIKHELGHGVLNDMFYGGTFQSAIASGSNFAIPLWMNEGYVEWMSIGGMNTETDMFMRDLIVSEQLPSLDRLDGYLAYRGGQTFYWYIEDKYGKEKVGDLLNRLKLYRNVELAFENTFQMSFKEFSEKWERDLKKYFLPDLSKFDNPKDYAIQLTNHQEDRSFYNSSPAISPDGKRMAYISAVGGTFGIFIKNIDEKGPGRRIISSFRRQDFEDLNMISPGISWNPKGDKLAISAKSGSEDAIFIVNPENGDYERLKFGLKSISSVEWSPDGNKLAFIGTDIERSDIFIYEFSNKTLTNITNDIFSDIHPSWGNDSETIYFISDRDNNEINQKNKNNFKMWKQNVYKTDIYKLNIKSLEFERITFDPENKKTSLALSNDNKSLLYVSDKNGIGNIYVMDLETKNTRPITNSLTGITQISLSKDASKLLFTTQANAGYDIYMLRFPLERNLKIDELPLTNFKLKELEKNNIVESLKKLPEEKLDREQLIGYGNLDIDFSNQKIVQPNIDINRNTTDIAKNVELDVNKEFQEFDYKISFSPDIILGNPGYSTYYGFQGITQMLFSDVMGDHQIYVQANLLIDLKNSQFFVAYNYLPNIIDYQFSAYHTSAFILGYDNYYYRFRNFGAGVLSSYPFSLFDRFELGAQFMYLTKENIDIPQAQSTEKYLVVPNARYVFDNTLWRFYGPFDGTRYYVGVSGSPKFSESSAGFATFSADFRQYFGLGDYFSLALRVAGAGSFGPDPQNFFLGGTDNWINRRFNNGRLPLEDPVDFAFMTFEMPLRGWAVSDVRGDKFFIGNFEFRFPLLTALVAGPLPILIQGINGAIFFDIGGAWYNEFKIKNDYGNGIIMPANLLMSSGIGIRSYFLGLPIKIDIAWRNEYTGWSEPYWLFSLGYDF